MSIDSLVAGPPAEELEKACGRARRLGYDPGIFRFSTYRPVHPELMEEIGLPSALVMVSVNRPGVEPRMYRAANGTWVDDFERDLVNLQFGRHSERPETDSQTTCRIT